MLSACMAIAVSGAGADVSVSGRIMHVSTAGSQEAPFLSPQTAATNILSALAIAQGGDTIIVDAGVYVVSRTIVIAQGVTVKGLGGAQKTILKGEGNCGIVSLRHTNASLEGFTITHGCEMRGGGVYLNGGTIRNCRILENSARQAGGGVFVEDGGLIERCEISHNRIVHGMGRGGGVAASKKATVRGCLISWNAATIGSGVWGSSLAAMGPGVVVEDCVVFRNRRPQGDGGSGGGLNLDGPSCVLRNSLVVENNDPLHGGAIQMTGGMVDRCTITRNSCFGRGRIMGGNGTVLDSIVYGNTVYDALADDRIVFLNCRTERKVQGTNNIVQDPCFMNPRARDFRLKPNSPCRGIGKGGGSLGADESVCGPR